MLTNGIALLLEDEAMITLDVAATVEGLGYDVVTHATRAGGLRWLIGHHTVAVAVIDVQLSDGPCDEVIDLVVKRGIPHIIHSAEPAPVAPFDQGAWVPKPSSSADIVAAIRAAVRTREELSDARNKAAPESNVVGH